MYIWDIKNPKNLKNIPITKKENNIEVVYFEELKNLKLFVLVTNKNDIIFFDGKL